MTSRRPPRRLIAAVVLTAIAFTGAACGGGDDDGAATEPGQVDVKDNSFSPRDLEVSAGDTVTWVWKGKIDHNVQGEGFKSEIQKKGEFTHTFEERGTFRYICTIHAGMKGEIKVV